MPSSDKSWGESSSKSRRKPIPWLVRSLNACHISFMTSTLKRECKCALVQNKKPVDNYVDASHKRSSYPQGVRSGALRGSARITARHQEVFHLSRAHRGQHLQVILLQGLLLRVLVRWELPQEEPLQAVGLGRPVVVLRLVVALRDPADRGIHFPARFLLRALLGLG